MNELDSLINVKSYFTLSKQFNERRTELNEVQQLRFGAIIDNCFNELTSSNRTIDLLFENYRDSLSKEEAKDLLTIKLSNSVKLFEYKKAALITQDLVSNYSDVIMESALWSIKNNGIIWQAISDHPKQRTIFSAPSRIHLVRDRAGLKNLMAIYRSKDFPFIFDTGANLSVIVESQAKAMDLDVIDVAVSVNTITGQRVDSKIGVAPRFKIGNMTFENVIFLVFPDEALYIPQIDYQIKGILGFPVISSMIEIHFLENDVLYVPTESNLEYESNMAIEYLTPFINLKNKDKDFHFTFDTGADHTMLYKMYFEEYREEIETKYPLTKIQFGGAGGGVDVKGYVVPFTPIVNEKEVVVDSVNVLPQLLNESDRYSYGNIGQDFISKFDRMVINFKKMFVHFE